MTYKLHMNGVLTGSLNSFCLACNSFLQSQQEATEHIGTSEHKNKSNAVQYSDKFKDEHIKKFKGGYYCEFCNVLMPIASKVNLHIAEEEHKQNKGILLLKPMVGDVVAFNNILIKENAWHGLIEGVCSLCNAEFEDERDHKSDASHSLNLVLKSIRFETDSAIYRLLDDTAVQCLTCNKLLAPCKMIQHFDGTEHQELYAKCRIESNGVSQAIETKENCQQIETKGGFQEKETNMTSVTKNTGEIKKPMIEDSHANNNEKPASKDKSKIFESLAKYQSKGININLETETAFCKKCSQVITFDLVEIESHIENHSSAVLVDSDLLYPSNLNQNLNRVDINDKTTLTSKVDKNTEVVNETIKQLQAEVQINSSSEDDNDTEEEQARDFAKANNITFIENQSYCGICKVHVPSLFRSMKEHVEGANHKKQVASSITQPKNPEKQMKRTKQTMQTTKEFVDSYYTVHSILHSACAIINEKFCFPRTSFHLISENNSRLRCILCEANLPPFSDVEDHAKKIQHNLKWLRVPVITSERNEFIREVRPGLYHCAYCNLVVSGWGDMKQHLECSDHRKNKSVGENRLNYHMPAVQRYKMQEQLEAMAMMRLFNIF